MVHNFREYKRLETGSFAEASADVDGEPDITLQPSEDDEKEFDSENDIPVENVKKQLGFGKRPELIMGDASCRFCEIFRSSTFGATEMF